MLEPALMMIEYAGEAAAACTGRKRIGHDVDALEIVAVAGVYWAHERRRQA